MIWSADGVRAAVVGAAVALSVSFVATPAHAGTVFVYHATAIEGGGADTPLVPQPLTTTATGDALAQEILRNLADAQPALYSGTSLTAGGGQVKVALGEAAMTRRDLVVGELFHSLSAAGFGEISIPKVQAAPITGDDITLSAFVPVYPLWTVLPPRKVGPGLVRVGGGHFMTVTRAQDRLAAGDAKLMEALRALVRTGPEAAQLAIIGFYEANSVTGRSAAYLAVLKPAESTPVKLAALKAVARFTNPRVLDVIAELADNDRDPVVKSAAARVLMENGRAKYKTYILLEKLQSDDIAVVLGATKELAASGDKRIAATLATLLTHADDGVRDAALDGLAQLGAYGELAAALDNEALAAPLRLRAAELLIASGDKARGERGLRYQLTHAEGAVAAAAADKLGERGAMGALTDLVAALEHSDASVRHAAARALGRMKARKALPALAEAAGRAEDKDVVEPEIISIVASMPLSQVIELTRSDVTVLRKLALKSLAEFAKERGKVPAKILTTLKARLKDADPEIRRAAVYALARTGDPSVIGDLMAMKDDSDEFIREQVIVAAANSSAPGTAELVVGKLKDPSDAVKLEAVKGVQKRKLYEAFPRLLWMVDYGRVEIKREVVRAIVQLAKTSDHGKLFDVYNKLLYDLDQEVKLLAVDGMKVIRDPRVVSQLGSLVRDPDEAVQLKVIAALGGSGDPRAVEYLAGALMVGSKKVKLASLDAMGQLRVEQAVKPIQEFLRNETDEDLRSKAAAVMDLLP